MKYYEGHKLYSRGFKNYIGKSLIRKSPFSISPNPAEVNGIFYHHG